jgi:flagellar hook assembly protein FlgD
VVSEAGASAGPLVTSATAVPAPQGVEIVQASSTAAVVDARVLNVAGRSVRTLWRGRECEAGTTTLVWDTRGDQGLPVPWGTYLVSVVATTPDGQQSHSLQQVRVGR